MANKYSLCNWFPKGIPYVSLDTILNSPVRIALLSSSFIPGTQEFYTDLTNELPTANGYTVGGQLLTGKSITGNVFKSANPSWTASGTLTAFYWVLYIDSGSKPLICYGALDYNGGTPINVSTQNGDPLTIYVATSGFFQINYQNGSL